MSGAGAAGVRCYLGLGSNLGDRLANLWRAADLLAGVEGLRLVASSRVYETAPVGPPQPEYLNAVLALDCSLSARKLLEACLGVERAMGRVHRERWGPRVIDVDVLAFDRQNIDEPDLRVPHPRMHERGFVLVPLLELDADPPLPVGRRVGKLVTAEGGFAGIRPFAPALPIPGR